MWPRPTSGRLGVRRSAAVLAVLVVTALTFGLVSAVIGRDAVGGQPPAAEGVVPSGSSSFGDVPASPSAPDPCPAPYPAPEPEPEQPALPEPAPGSEGEGSAADAVDERDACDAEDDARADGSEPPATVPQGEPVRVVIPAIAVDVALVRLGLRPDRAMEVPAFGLAGWYAEGPRPGHPGPAVLVGHVDSRAGPDVFFRLRDLAAGDQVRVEYDSGDHVVFVVTRSEQTPKDALPVESIWPHTDDRLLALITCGGTFDRSARSYQDNVIVYARPLVRLS